MCMSQEYKKILVANDGSEHAKKALQAAIWLAKCLGAELHSISVEEDLPKYVATVGEIEEVKRRKDAYFAQIVAESKELAKKQGVELHAHIIAGHEVETIVNFCREGQFDLLVIGFMGHSKVFGRVWGSTSQNLAKLAPCAVLIVK